MWCLLKTTTFAVVLLFVYVRADRAFAQGHGSFPAAAIVGVLVGPTLLNDNKSRKNSYYRIRSDPNSTLVKISVDFGTKKSEFYLSERDLVRMIQKVLLERGYEVGPVDGAAGPRTRKAISAYQADQGWEPTGTLSKEAAAALIKPFLEQHKVSRLVLPSVHGNLETNNSYKIASLSVSSQYFFWATRIFGGPTDYPPTEYAAYGIVAFNSKASNYDRKRHEMICEAYVSSIVDSRKSQEPKSKQMATVWPIESDEIAKRVRVSNGSELCKVAVESYGLKTSQKAIREAELAGTLLRDRGPYLIAWSPSNKKGAPDAVVLVADFSKVDEYEDAQILMQRWVHDIEQDPGLWSQGWSLDKLRTNLQTWFDSQGTKILMILKNSSQ